MSTFIEPGQIPLKSDLHYDKLLAGKILQLKESFQHKLGYLVGHAYSRVGTEDFPQDRFKETVKNTIELIPHDVLKLKKEEHKYIIKNIKKLNESEQTVETMDTLQKEYAKNQENNKKRGLEILEELLMELHVENKTIGQVTNRLNNKVEFWSCLK